MTGVVAQTRSVPVAKLEALAEELAHLKTAVDMMASSIESMLADIRADLPCELSVGELSGPAALVAQEVNCEQGPGNALASTGSVAAAPPTPLPAEVDSGAISDAGRALIEMQTRGQAICCTGEPAPAGSTDASLISIAIPADASRAVEDGGQPADAVIPPGPTSVPSKTTHEIGATPSELPSNLGILSQGGKILAAERACRVLPRLRWAAAVALIVTLMGLAAVATGFADRHGAELRHIASAKIGPTVSVGRPAGIVEELWRLRARSAF